MILNINFERDTTSPDYQNCINYHDIYIISDNNKQHIYIIWNLLFENSISAILIGYLLIKSFYFWKKEKKRREFVLCIFLTSSWNTMSMCMHAGRFLASFGHQIGLLILFYK